MSIRMGARTGTRQILLVVLTKHWTSSERIFMSYARALSHRGHKLHFYIKRDSYIDLSVKELIKSDDKNCKIFYHIGNIKVGLLRWGNYRYVRKIVVENNIDLIVYHTPIHFYPISFLLRRFFNVSQFIYQNAILTESFRNIWLAPMKMRLDTCFTPVPEAIGNIKGALGVTDKKIKVIGPCFNDAELNNEKGLKWSDTELIMGVIFPPCKKNMDSLLPLFKALSVLLKVEELQNIRVKLKIFTECKWELLPFINELTQFLEKEAIQNNVELIDGVLGVKSNENGQTLHDFIKNINICLGIESNCYMEDWEVLAPILGKPFLSTRHASSKEFLRKNGAIGETYRTGDVREIKDKVLKLYHSRELIGFNLESLAKNLIPLYQSANVVQAIEERFEISLVRRRRISRRLGVGVP